MPEHRRRSIRLPDYDYSSPGTYFVTLVTANRENLFGEIIGGEMKCNRFGFLAENEWRRLSVRFPGIQLDEFVVMPNHLHGIIIIVGDHPVGANVVGARQKENSTSGRVGASRVGARQKENSTSGSSFLASPLLSDTASSLPATASSLPATASPLPATASPLSDTASSLPDTASSLPDTAAPLSDTTAPLSDTAAPLLSDTAAPLPATAAPLPLANHPTPPPSGSLGNMVGAFKSTSARLINGLRRTPGASIWQRNYYERIIRDQDEWQRTRTYIQTNPANWQLDTDNPLKAR